MARPAAGQPTDHAKYLGTELSDDSLVPGPDAELGFYGAELGSSDTAATLNAAEHLPG